MITPNWQDKRILWDAPLLDERKDAAEWLVRKGAMNYVRDDPGSEERTDLFILENDSPVDTCIAPVLRNTDRAVKEDILTSDSFSKDLATEEFIKKLCFWSETAKLAKEEGISTIPAIDEETTQSLERLAGGDVLRIGRKKFLKSSTLYLGRLDANRRDTDEEEVKKLLHTIKGSSGTIGAKQVSFAAKNWESRVIKLRDITVEYDVRYSLLIMLIEYFRFRSRGWSKL